MIKCQYVCNLMLEIRCFPGEQQCFYCEGAPVQMAGTLVMPAKILNCNNLFVI